MRIRWGLGTLGLGIVLALATPSWAQVQSPVSADTIANPVLDNQERFTNGLAAFDAGHFEEAFRIWTPLAENGDPKVEFNLGQLYASGKGVPQNYAEAVNWWRKAADQGIASAQWKLGLAYELGQGAPQDYGLAASLYRQAGGQGNEQGELRLGLLYARGLGVPKDDVESYKWLSLAVPHLTDSKLRDQMNELRSDLANRMSAAETAEARKLIDAWKPVAQVDAAISAAPKSSVADADVLRQLKAGAAACEKGNFKDALMIWMPLADSGNPAAQNGVGTIYYDGDGVPRDYAAAVAWFQKAADQGNVGAQYDLGYAFKEGHGVKHDYAMAVHWFRKAADQGQVDAQYQLGELYGDGDGVTESHFLSDFALAAEWYRKAADAGHALAQENLGIQFAIGVGVPKDNVAAYKWFSLAATHAQTPDDQKDALKQRDRTAKKMTADQIADAEAQVRAWKPIRSPSNGAVH